MERLREICATASPVRAVKRAVLPPLTPGTQTGTPSPLPELLAEGWRSQVLPASVAVSTLAWMYGA